LQRDRICASHALPLIGGFVGPGFEEVALEFERNFTDRGEVGAAFAAARGNEMLVDLWGGLADRQTVRPWREDTLQFVFSGAKGVVAICMPMLHERDVLAFDASVEHYLPAFGKPQVRVRDVMSHTARLPGIDRPLTFEPFLDRRCVLAQIEAQAQSDDPRAVLCYDPYNYGWICDEIVRRINGRTIGRFVAEEIAAPLQLELWIGLPEELESRVSTVELSPTPTAPNNRPEVLESDPFLRSVWGNPPAFRRDYFPWNSRAYHAAEIPGAGAIATARSLARLYANVDRLLSPASIELGRTTVARGRDELHGGEAHFGIGFELQTARMHLGPEPRAFGHGGAGGSVHGAWPEHGIGFSYAMNELRDDKDVDPRSERLLDALHRAVTN
jgi:CubicO group peptidase (beta-lactamase class C family)